MKAKVLSVAFFGAIGGLLMATSPAKADCYPYSAYGDYEDYKVVTSKQQALRLSLKENHDGSSSCKIKINARFMEKEGWQLL